MNVFYIHDGSTVQTYLVKRQVIKTDAEQRCSVNHIMSSELQATAVLFYFSSVYNLIDLAKIHIIQFF